MRLPPNNAAALGCSDGAAASQGPPPTRPFLARQRPLGVKTVGGAQSGQSGGLLGEAEQRQRPQHNGDLSSVYLGGQKAVFVKGENAAAQTDKMEQRTESHSLVFFVF